MIRAAALLAWLVLAASFCAVAAAQSVFPDDFERVASFHADIAIAPDGALTVRAGSSNATAAVISCERKMSL